MTIFALLSCTKSEDPAPTTHMSFKMNGTEYKFDVTQFDGGSPATGDIRLRSGIIPGASIGTQTDFPYWFDLRKSNTGTICAVLMPKEFHIPYIENAANCNFAIPTTDIDGNPLSAEQVFHYESGTITFSKHNCGNKPYFDIRCVCTLKADVCDLKGSFNLTFRNGVEESITLSDGTLFIAGDFQ